MRFIILSSYASLCGCFVAGSRASELISQSSVRNWTSPSFLTDDASVIFKGALSPHNETEIGKFAIDDTNEEARAFTIEEEIGNIAHAFKDLVAKEMKNVQNLLENRPTTRKRKNPPDRKLFERMKTLQQKSQRTKKENGQLLKHIQLLQDHEDLHFQTTGAASLVDMLRSGTNKNINDARLVKGEEPAEGSETKWFDQEVLEPWIAYVGKWLNTDVLTLKQALLYESLMTRLSENEMNELAVAVTKVEGGDTAILRLVLIMMDEPLTRERAFRLQLVCGINRGTLMKALIYKQNQNPASLPLNVWLEFVAYTRFSQTFSDRMALRAFATAIFNELEESGKVPLAEQKLMFTSIVKEKAYQIDMVKKKQEFIAFKWIPDDQNEVSRINNGFVDHAEATAFNAALNSEAVVKAFRAVEVANIDQALTEAQKDPNGVALLSKIIKDGDHFKLFKAALMIRQLKKFAEEYLEFWSPHQ